MPKVKTNRAAAKRFKKTGSGKVKRASSFRRHILTSKTTKRKRQLRKTKYIADVDMKAIQTLLPN